MWLCCNCEKGHSSCMARVGAGVRSWEVLFKLPLTCVGVPRLPCPLPVFLEPFPVLLGTCLSHLLPCLWKARQEKQQLPSTMESLRTFWSGSKGQKHNMEGEKGKESCIHPGSRICCFSFTTHPPQVQVKHARGHGSNRLPDLRCCPEKAPASSLVGAHQGSM